MDNQEVQVVSENVPDIVPEQKKDTTTKLADFGEQIEKLLPLVGTINLSEEEKKILFAPVDESVVEIRPDGLIYAPWMEFVMRLRNAVGLNWALIPVGFPKTKGETVLWPHWMIIRGIPTSFSIGEQLWSSSNARMSWAEACEGARSNSLMRCCKALGIFLELWQPSFIRQWKDKFAGQVEDKGKMIWIKKSGQVLSVEQAVEKTKEIFPGSEVVPGATGSAMPPTRISEGKPMEGEKSSALMFVDYHDTMVRLSHLSVLRDYWTKIAPEAETKLHPEHFKQLVELKTKLRQGFIDKASKKGGK